MYFWMSLNNKYMYHYVLEGSNNTNMNDKNIMYILIL